ncbi:hypothetical protein SAMN04488121_103940 [Chitinophaga filiformis]|uniref:Uncharacterized protein n=1 Tax=Chitinophaga filiformis TaxID=104663 RepID=A0A1G7SMW6_CHIFI|nr:hypothetical protein SAMN04488121_103940 [Chitinophaga filiformis]
MNTTPVVIKTVEQNINRPHRGRIVCSPGFLTPGRLFIIINDYNADDNKPGNKKSIDPVGVVVFVARGFNPGRLFITINDYNADDNKTGKQKINRPHRGRIVCSPGFSTPGRLFITINEYNADDNKTGKQNINRPHRGRVVYSPGFQPRDICS